MKMQDLAPDCTAMRNIERKSTAVTPGRWSSYLIEIHLRFRLTRLCTTLRINCVPSRLKCKLNVCLFRLLTFLCQLTPLCFTKTANIQEPVDVSHFTVLCRSRSPQPVRSPLMPQTKLTTLPRFCPAINLQPKLENISFSRFSAKFPTFHF